MDRRMIWYANTVNIYANSRIPSIQLEKDAFLIKFITTLQNLKKKNKNEKSVFPYETPPTG